MARTIRVFLTTNILPTPNPNPTRHAMSDKLMITSQLLQEDFIDLVSDLPDEFFHLPGPTRDAYWDLVHHRLLKGETSIPVLLALVDQFINPKPAETEKSHDSAPI